MALHDLPAAAADPGFERVAARLLDGLQWHASVFHVGQYCGRWRASTAGHARASFHLVLEGRCWLHRPGQPSLALAAGDGVLLPRDLPHFLSPYADAGIACAAQPMQPLAAPGTLGATGLACGFFAFEGPMQALLLATLPEPLLLRAGEDGGDSASALFPLMLAEARRQGSTPSVLMDRLCGLLFFYALRGAAEQGAAAPRGLWALLRRPGFAPLLLALFEQPAHPWTVQEMARRVHLSRAAFFRQFGEACGQSPLQFLLLVRMQMAAARLEQGESITRAAEAVGYASYAAFARAFKRVVGAQPGAWQRARTRVPP